MKIQKKYIEKNVKICYHVNVKSMCVQSVRYMNG